MEETLTLTGFVDHVVYRREESAYTVLILRCDDVTMQENEFGEEERNVTVTGELPELADGEYISFAVKEMLHPVYGRQYQVISFEFRSPSDSETARIYLASGAVKGIGPALAERIVKKFGEETFAIIEKEPERLAEIKGISLRKAQEIAAEVAVKQSMRNAMIFLQKYGISLNLSMKIYEKYRDSVYSVLRENPYRLAEDVNGIGFKKADEIAMAGGIRTDAGFRIHAGIIYAMQDAIGEGHTCLPFSEAVEKSVEILGLPEDMVERTIEDMFVTRELLLKKADGAEYIYLPSYYYMELKVAKGLIDLNTQTGIDRNFEKKFEKVCREQAVDLDDNQKKCVRKAMTNGVLVITGGPGTGKTTTLNSIIRMFEERNMEVLLAAPTGRAARRMTETTGREARTIHRLLEVSGGAAPAENGAEPGRSGGMRFERNAVVPLETDVVIVDEASMIDIFLMSALVDAIPIGTKLILVGDVNQLPSVGPGNVLRDIIDSGAFSVVCLKTVFRQAMESDIVVNAHKINNSERVDLEKKDRDFIFIGREEIGKIIGATVTLVRDKLPGYVNAKCFDIQVLTPMRKGALGVEQLNRELQRELNPPSAEKREKEFGAYVFREGDKVMQVRNNYQIEWVKTRTSAAHFREKGTGIFNGDCGIIRIINPVTEEMIILFDDDREVVYPFKNLEELEPAYAITIHKSQGSEYPAVVIPLLTGPKMLMTRNLLYTAVTRAKSCVTIVGSSDMFYSMAGNCLEQKRYSGLKERITELA